MIIIFACLNFVSYVLLLLFYLVGHQWEGPTICPAQAFFLRLRLKNHDCNTCYINKTELD